GPCIFPNVCLVRAPDRGERPPRWHEGFQPWDSLQEVHNDVGIIKSSAQEVKIGAEENFSADPGGLGGAQLSLARDHQFQRQPNQWPRQPTSGVERNRLRRQSTNGHGYIYRTGRGTSDARFQWTF